MVQRATAAMAAITYDSEVQWAYMVLEGLFRKFRGPVVGAGATRLALARVDVACLQAAPVLPRAQLQASPGAERCAASPATGRGSLRCGHARLLAAEVEFGVDAGIRWGGYAAAASAGRTRLRRGGGGAFQGRRRWRRRSATAGSVRRTHCDSRGGQRRGSTTTMRWIQAKHLLVNCVASLSAGLDSVPEMSLRARLLSAGSIGAEKPGRLSSKCAELL